MKSDLRSLRVIRVGGAVAILAFGVGGCGLTEAMEPNVDRDEALAAYKACLAAHASDVTPCDSAAQAYVADLSNAHRRRGVLY